MCGRFNLTASSEAIKSAFKLDQLAEYEPSYNIAPSQLILNITRLPDDSFQAAYTQWGLVPSWSKDRISSLHLTNARAETLAEKPSFRSAFKQRRCLIPATGFFEWHKTETDKQPYLISRVDKQVFAFAGLWEYWEHNSETLYSCTIITTAANAIMQPIHERMPVIIDKAHYADWLSAAQPPERLQQILTLDAYAEMQLQPISKHVNSPFHNDPRCLK